MLLGLRTLNMICAFDVFNTINLRDTTHFDSEDDYRTGCRNVSHCQQQQCYSGLRSSGRSCSAYLKNYEMTRELKPFTVVQCSMYVYLWINQLDEIPYMIWQTPSLKLTPLMLLCFYQTPLSNKRPLSNRHPSWQLLQMLKIDSEIEQNHPSYSVSCLI